MADMRRSYLREYGFTLKEIGAHIGVNNSRVRQLINAGSKRIPVAVKEMKAAKRKGKA